ncbi:hypothetical protein R3P38DRAFT_3305836 [Favolaschia claudopus]|uniref:Uncharacterized protein n=1 Tax=Favolaschia claudopus TaxID=2862362 RepID=A0AAW0DKN4_9AGAR
MSKGTVLVTGAARGLGKEIALRLADDGFDVAVNDIASNRDILLKVVEEIKAKNRASSAHVADVSDEGQVKGVFDEVVKTYGGLDVWVNISEMSVDDWDRTMAVNCRGVFLCYKYAGLQMIQQGRGGRIIGACSTSGKRASSPFMAAYAASKFAVRGLTQAAALEFGVHGITVNAYAPGPVQTDLLDYLDASNAEATGNAPGSFTQAATKWGPLGRVGVPADVANLVSFIASKESAFITGV